MATFQVCQPTGWTGLVVGWAVVRSLAGFPAADPSGSDYLGGSCLLFSGPMTLRALRYSDSLRSGYVDIVGRKRFPVRASIVAAAKVVSLDPGISVLMLGQGLSQSPRFPVRWRLQHRRGHWFR